MNLRPYQNSLITGLAHKIAKGKNSIVAQLATGGGKTVCFASIADRYIKKNPGKSVLILVHRKELLKQTRHTCYRAAKLDCQPIIAGMKYIPPADLYVGMVESAWRRLDKIKNLGLVVIDECHRLEFAKFYPKLEGIIRIGFTATPLTASKKKPLHGFYEDIVCGVDIPELIKDGHLCQNITWAPKEVVDRRELTVKGDDFDEVQMAITFRKPKYILNTVKAYEKWAKGTKTIVFNVNIEHSLEVQRAFTDAGYNCKHLDGTTPEQERARILHWFATTPDAILCNVNITTTGFDEPTIETVLVNRATMSMPLWLQMCGRGSRPTEAKSAFTIVDMGANAIAHGDWCQSRNWTDIFFDPPKPGKPTAAPVKSCPECEAIIPASSKTCPFCGYIYPDKSRDVEAELYEFIILTKGIDVQKVIEENKNKKEHYPFFKIGKDLAEEAKKTVQQMTDEYANFILQIYLKLAKEWMKKYKESSPDRQHKKFSRWYYVKAQEHLFQQLKEKFPKWETSYLNDKNELIPGNAIKPVIAITGIKKIVNL